MKKKLLSELEWQVMKTIWQSKKPVAVKEVWQRKFPNGEKAYTTIQTYMDRLVEKGILAKEKIGLVNFYRPLLSQKEAVEVATESLVSRAFNGSFGTLAAFLINSRHLSPDDLEKIKKMIQEKEENRK